MDSEYSDRQPASCQIQTVCSLLAAIQDEVKCVICWQNIDETVELECKHKLCGDCFSQLKERKQRHCPLCKTLIGKRAPIYKDHFADELGKFISKVSQRMKEKYDRSVAPARRKQKKAVRKGSQSLSIQDNLPEPLLKKYQSLTEGLDDNYSIEDVHSETFAKQVEIKVVQDLLEDECLANLEQAVRVANKTAKDIKTPPKRKGFDKQGSSEKNTSNSPKGWDIIGDVKTGTKKSPKEPKPLKINVQNKAKNTSKEISPEQNKKRRKVSPQKGGTSANTKRLQKTDITEPTKDVDLLDVLLAPTQPANLQQKGICYIPPISTDCDDLDSLATSLITNLRNCLSSAELRSDELGLPLVECFSNLLCQSEKLLQVIPEKNNITCRCKSSVDHVTASTQTVDSKFVSAAVQADIADSSKLLQNKWCQTVTICRHAEVQTDDSTSRACHTQTFLIPTAGDGADRREKKLEHYGNVIADGATTDKNNLIPKLRNKDKASQGEKSIEPTTSSSSKYLLISTNEFKLNKSSRASNITSQKSVSIVNLEPSNKSERKIKRKLSYAEADQSTKFKRIRKPDSDSDSEEEQANKRPFIRDDLTVEFANTEDTAAESEKMDYDQYLLDVMSKFDAEPTRKSGDRVERASKIENELNRFSKDGSHLSLEKRVTQSAGKADRLGSDTVDDFTPCSILENNLDKFDQQISEYEFTRMCNTEFEVVENTPMASPKAKISRLSNKKSAILLNGRSQILSKGQCSSTNTKLMYMSINKDTSKITTPCTLDRNIREVSRSKEIPNEVEEILKDLRNNDEFFKTCPESGVFEDTNKPASSKDFEDDEEIEDELRKISFPSSPKPHRAVTTLSENRSKSDIIDLEQIVEASDDEVVETTPQKKKGSSADRSILRNLNEQETVEPECDDLDFCLPPPPGFGDEHVQNLTVLSKTPPKQKENYPPLEMRISSLTPDGLSDFIVTPESRPIDNTEDLASDSFALNTMLTPNRTSKGKMASRKSPKKITDELEGPFTSVAKSSIRKSQITASPLVFSTRSAKKPSLMTSTPNQQSILNFVVPSQQTTSESQKFRPCVMWSRILNKDLNIFTQLECKKLITISGTFTPHVTHLIVIVDDRGRIVTHTAKILQAIAAGIWVVRYEWAEDCLRMNKIVAEEPYEALDTTGKPGPQLSRLNRKSKPLFAGYRFYIAPPVGNVPKQDLETIIQLAGGEIAGDLTDFLEKGGFTDIIIIESSATEDTEQFEGWLETFKTVTVDVEWLSCCVCQYKLLSFRPYLVAGDESTISELGYPSTLVESVPFTLTETC